MTESGIKIVLNYSIEYLDHSSNRPARSWFINPLTFEVSGVKPTSKARVVFTNFLNKKGYCGLPSSDVVTTYYVDLKPGEDKMTGDLNKDSFLIGEDRNNYALSGNAPVTKADLYCSASQANKQLVAIVVDDVWQTAREILRDGQTTKLEDNSNDFELHLESL